MNKAMEGWRRQEEQSFPLLMGHRGAPFEAPENTIAAFRLAVDAGADILEMDVRTTADGHLVVFHDEEVDRMVFDKTQRGLVNALSLEEFQSLRLTGGKEQPDLEDATFRIPLFKDVLDEFPDSRLNIDLSAVSDTDVSKVFEWLRKRVEINPKAKYLTTSEHTNTQAAIRKENAGNLVANGMGWQDAVEVLKAAWLGRPPIERLRGVACQIPLYYNVFGFNVPLLTTRVRNYLRKLQSPLHVWYDTEGPHTMINTEEHLKLCMQWQVDAIFTDNIREMALLREKYQN